jgi:hypothetical protein
MNSIAYFTLDGELLLSNAIISFPTLSWNGSIILNPLQVIISTDTVVKAKSTGKISGPMLSNNLQRQANLAFDTNLLYLDVENQRIGINNDIPSKTLSVNTITSNSIISNVANISNLTFDNSITNIFDNINIIPHQSSPQINIKQLQVGNINFSQNTITADILTFNELVTSSININTIVNTNPVSLASFKTTDITIQNTIKSNDVLKFDVRYARFSGLVLTKGTTSNRPTVVENGLTRYNTTTNLIETFYNGWTSMGFPSDSLSLNEVNTIMFMWSVILG